jgi:hypothetical protein
MLPIKDKEVAFGAKCGEHEVVERLDLLVGDTSE